MPKPFLIGIVVCLSVFPGLASAQVSLSWKFKEGEKFFVEKVETIKLSADSIGKPVTQELETTTVISFRVVKVDGDKITLEQKFEGARFKGDGSGDDAVKKLMDRLEGVSLTVNLDSAGKIVSINGYDEALKKLTEGKEKADGLENVFNLETIKVSLNEIFGFLPDKPVKKGDTWSHFTRMPLGPYGFLQGDYVFTFNGVDEKAKDKVPQGLEIGLKGKLSFDFPKGGIVAPGIKVTQAEFKSPSQEQPSVSGTYWFNSDTGRLISSEVNIDIKGTLTLEKQDTSLTVNLELKTNSKTRLLDKNPSE